MLVSVIGFIECMIAAKRYAHKNDYQVYPNRELVAIGAQSCSRVSFAI